MNYDVKLDLSERKASLDYPSLTIIMGRLLFGSFSFCGTSIEFLRIYGLAKPFFFLLAGDTLSPCFSLSMLLYTFRYIFEAGGNLICSIDSGSANYTLLIDWLFISLGISILGANSWKSYSLTAYFSRSNPSDLSSTMAWIFSNILLCCGQMLDWSFENISTSYR